MEFVDTTIEFSDGSTETVAFVTRQVVVEGCLHLFKKNGAMAEEEHLGSYPLTSIKKWQRRRRQ